MEKLDKKEKQEKKQEEKDKKTDRMELSTLTPPGWKAVPVRGGGN